MAQPENLLSLEEKSVIKHFEPDMSAIYSAPVNNSLNWKWYHLEMSPAQPQSTDEL